MRHQHPGVAPWLRVDPDDDLVRQVLRNVRDEAVLPDHDDEVVRGEQEPGQVDPFDQATPPVWRDRGGNGGECRCHRFVPVLQVLDPPPAGAQVERGLTAGTVPLKQLGQLGAPVHQHDARRERHRDSPASTAPAVPPEASFASSDASMSGEMTSVPICGRLPARSFAARASSVDGGRSWYAATDAASPAAFASPRARVPSARASARARSLAACASNAIRPAAAASSRLPPRVGALLLEQLLLAAGELDLALQLIFGDSPFPLHSNRPPFIGGPVRLLLDGFPRGGAQRLLDVRLRAQRDDARAHDRDPGLGEPGVGGEPRDDPVPDLGDAGRERRRQGAVRDEAEDVLLRGLGEQPRDLLQGRAAPPPGVGVNGEVNPRGRDRRVGDPERHARLHRQVLEVRRPRVEQQRQLPVVHWYLRQDRRQRPEPERQPGPVVHRLPSPQVPDVQRGVTAQVPGEEVLLDVRHDCSK